MHMLEKTKRKLSYTHVVKNINKSNKMIDIKSLKFGRRKKLRKEYTEGGNILFSKLSMDIQVFVLFFTSLMLYVFCVYATVKDPDAGKD